MEASYYIVFFMIYSFLGWVYESTICSVVKYQRLINRGYLVGPYCPIYGVGAIANWIILGDKMNLTNGIHIFVIAMVVSLIIEYYTSYIMEKIFHLTWWDYSDMPFNLNGRICLYGGLLFGVINVVLIKIIQPGFMRMVQYAPRNGVRLVAVAFLVVFTLDVVLTTISMKNLNDTLKQIHDTIRGKMDQKFEDLNQREQYIDKNMVVSKGRQVIVSIQNMSRKMKGGEVRLLDSLPEIRSMRYSSVLDKLRECLKRGKEE